MPQRRSRRGGTCCRERSRPLRRLRGVTTAHLRGAAVTVGLLLLVRACADAGEGTRSAPTSARPPSGSSHTLVLQVASTGGFMGPGWWQAELPRLSVYA